MKLRQENDEYDFLDSDIPYVSNAAPSVPPGLDPESEEVGGAYMTVSQQASESRARPPRENANWSEKS